MFQNHLFSLESNKKSQLGSCEYSIRCLNVYLTKIPLQTEVSVNYSGLDKFLIYNPLW